MYKNPLIIVLIISILIIFTGCAAGETAKLVGLSHGFVNIEGIDALYTNPALVGEKSNSFVLHLNGQGAFNNNAISSDFFKDMEDIEELEEDIKEDILTNLAGNPLTFSGRGVQGIDVQFGKFTFFAGAREVAAATLSADIVDLIFNGYTDGNTYDFSGSGGDMAVYSDVGLNYSQPLKSAAEKLNLKSLRIGGTFHYLNGAVACFDSEGSITINEPVVTGDGLIEGKYAEKGNGYSLDVGISAAVNDKLSWGISVMNIGSISGNDPRLYKYGYDVEEENFVKKEDAPLASFKYTLPLEIKAGTKLKMTDMLNIYGDFSYINYDSGKVDQQYAGGAEINVIKFLPLRLGVKYSSLEDNFIYAGGCGLNLGPVKANIGISDLGAIFSDSRSLSLAIDASLAF